MKQLIHLISAFLLAVVLCLTAATANAATLTVGLYPYVPNLQQFKTAITAAWQQVQPKVPLVFLTPEQWDGGYEKDPPPNADVYVFDAMFFEYFRSNNRLERMEASEIDNLFDFVDYAIDGVKVKNAYYSIPQLGCANILFYHKDETAIAKATTLSQLNSALSKCTYTSAIPPDRRRGLMIDMAGGTTDAALYLDTEHSLTGKYPFTLPYSESEIDPAAMANIKKMLAMASFENATANPLGQQYVRGTWFSNGWGRAVVGFTESMSAMSPATREDIRFKVMPLSDNSAQPLFYADVIAVNPATKLRHTRPLAVQLANVMASSTTMIASIGPNTNAGNRYPQYLMATRRSVFETLGHSFPQYKEMHKLITDNNPIMFKVSDQSRDWLEKMKETLRSVALSSPACGCDYPASAPIASNSAAPPICKLTCDSYGGWNGQWTNQPPAAPNGSVCGCKACPTP